MNVVVVVGNPRMGSRTRQAADMVAERLTGTPPTAAVELAELGPALLEWGSSEVGAAKQVVFGRRPSRCRLAYLRGHLQRPCSSSPSTTQ
jgi:FMN reductase